MKQRQNIVSVLNVISKILLTSALDRVQAGTAKKMFRNPDPLADGESESQKRPPSQGNEKRVE